MRFRSVNWLAINVTLVAPPTCAMWGFKLVNWPQSQSSLHSIAIYCAHPLVISVPERAQIRRQSVSLFILSWELVHLATPSCRSSGHIYLWPWKPSEYWLRGYKQIEQVGAFVNIETEWGSNVFMIISVIAVLMICNFQEDPHHFCLIYRCYIHMLSNWCWLILGLQ